MCSGQNCPIRQDCYRFTAKILGRQDFFGQVPYNFNINCCEFFMSNRPTDTQIRLRAYEIWEKMGNPDGKSTEHWFQAETELINNFKDQT
ncbi:hypothetical protein NIES2101_43690 [Calothrix sp. HK-06]|nr:hypothetical protein NIES2101_43690 [Calothrix sp. HK-06]